MGAVYLLCLLAGIGCMLLLDARFRLFFWHDAAVATLVTAVGVIGLLLWDAVGILTGIFLRGDSGWATGIVLAPEMPLEEPVFLLFLVLCTMVLYTGSARILSRGASGRGTSRRSRNEPAVGSFTDPAADRTRTAAERGSA